jgi:hypothetical protein
MPETDVLTEQLRALSDLGTDELSLSAVRVRVEQELQPLLNERASSRRTRRPAWLSRGALVSVGCALVAIAVVAAALALGSHSTDRTTIAPGPGRLIARLAVLRRPQTPDDRLPADLRVVRGLTGTIQPRLTRLVAQRHGIRLYLVVTTPAQQPGGLRWPARLGDQVSLISIRGHLGQQSAPVPAADLDDATQLITLLPRVGGIGPVQIVPDGVARVRWTYPGRPHRLDHLPVMTTAANNLVTAPPPRATEPKATWLRADGTVIPTSDALQNSIQASTDAYNVRTIAHALAQTRYHAPAALLKGFAVFAHRTLTRGGITVSRPRLAATPLSILGFVADFNGKDAVDVAHLRVVTFPAGRRMWVLPEVDAMCVVRLAAPGGPPANEVFLDQPAVLVACSHDSDDALAHGVGLTGAGTKGRGAANVAFGILPRRHPTVEVRTAAGQRTIRPPLGSYDIVTRRRR